MTGVNNEILNNLNESEAINTALLNLVATVASQTKYSSNENTVSDVFSEIRGMLEEYEDSINPNMSYEEAIKYLRCE